MNNLFEFDETADLATIIRKFKMTIQNQRIDYLDFFGKLFFKMKEKNRYTFAPLSMIFYRHLRTATQF